MNVPALVGIDLLPPEIAEGRERKRNLMAIAAMGMVLLLTLMVFFASESNRLVAAEQQRDVEEAEVSRLRGEEGALFEFGALEQGLAANVQVLQAALAAEIGTAAVLQDLAAVLPTDAGLDRLTFTTETPNGIATLVLAGESRAGIAPGIERLMIALDKVSSFTSPTLTSSIVDLDYTIFEIRLVIDEGAYTRRYVTGVPGELR